MNHTHKHFVRLYEQFLLPLLASFLSPHPYFPRLPFKSTPSRNAILLCTFRLYAWLPCYSLIFSTFSLCVLAKQVSLSVSSIAVLPPFSFPVRSLSWHQSTPLTHSDYDRSIYWFDSVHFYVFYTFWLSYSVLLGHFMLSSLTLVIDSVAFVHFCRRWRQIVPCVDCISAIIIRERMRIN